MNNRKHKSDIPEVVIDYCIDEKLTVAEGLVAYIEDHFAVVDSALRDLKREVTAAIGYSDKELAEIDKLDEKREMDDIESFLKFLEQQQPEDLGDL